MPQARLQRVPEAWRTNPVRMPAVQKFCTGQGRIVSEEKRLPAGDLLQAADRPPKVYRWFFPALSVKFCRDVFYEKVGTFH